MRAHCVLEAYTYYKRIKNWKKLKEEFHLPQKTPVCICPLFFSGSIQANDLSDLEKEKSGSCIYELFKKINRDIQSTQGSKHCCLAFAQFNRTNQFGKVLPDDLKASVKYFDEIN